MFTSLITTAILLSGFTSALPRPNPPMGEAGMYQPEPAMGGPSYEPAMGGSYEPQQPPPVVAPEQEAPVYEPEAPIYEPEVAESQPEAPVYEPAPPVHEAEPPIHEPEPQEPPPVVAPEQEAPVYKPEPIPEPIPEPEPAVVAPQDGPAYGSGYDEWTQGYDECVQSCMATYGGAPTNVYTPPAAAETPVVEGGGAVHTVIVAPQQGVLRYVPFAVNAAVGDTIMFMWGADNHTVTKGTSLTPCNRSADALFTSGKQNNGFMFSQTVNTTEPTFFYCATPSHCSKGMFGIINPASDVEAPTSVKSMMPAVAANNSDVQAYATYTANMTAGAPGSSWGDNLDMNDMPEWTQPLVMENVLYTRNLLAANPEIVDENGAISLSSMTETPLLIPDDVSASLSNAAAVPEETEVAAETPTDNTAATEEDSETAAAEAPQGSATTVAASKVLASGAAIFVMFFFL